MRIDENLQGLITKLWTFLLMLAVFLKKITLLFSSLCFSCVPARLQITAALTAPLEERAGPKEFVLTKPNSFKVRRSVFLPLI